jgi:arylsulfatase A-like enzyme
MAREGMRLTSFYVTSGVCTPSRASLLTGCYPRRINMHVDPLGGAVLRPVSSKGLHPDDVTIAEVLKTRGYATACIGKWHLGDQLPFLPTRQGFDFYYGIPYSDDMTARPGKNWPPLPLVKGHHVVEAPADRHTLTRRYTEKAIEFIEAQRNQPFFLYLAHAMPGSTLRPFAGKAFQGRSANGPYGDSVEEIDWSTGQIVDRLKDLGLDEHTLVIWTSDNGAPRRVPPQGSNAPLGGWGYTTMEGGMRVPCVVRWPGRVPEGRECDELATTMDLLPTLARLAGARLPEGKTLDGHDILPLLLGRRDARTPYDAFFYYHKGQLHAIRAGKWKLHLALARRQIDLGGRRQASSAKLYNLEDDVGETKNLAGNHPEIAARLARLAEHPRSDLGDDGREGSGQRPAGFVENPRPLIKQIEKPVSGGDNASAQRRPNIVFILTDNHGAWTLGCYGNRDIHTPHIDRLAREGRVFSRCFANNAVCSPTRATLLTGLMPCQHGVHCYLRAGGAQIGPQAYNTLEEFDTLPSLLADAGYVCGLSGKWHLGGNLRPQEGFSFWVTKPHGHSQGFYDQEVIENGKIRREPSYLTDFWTDRGVEFIRASRDRPFFLLLAYNGPYGLGKAMHEPIRNRHRQRYADAQLPSFPRTKPHPWNFNYGNRIGELRSIRKYAAEISGIDDGVGRVLRTLEELGLADETLVIFTADQGMSGGHSGFWGMGDHTRPLTAFDWTTHIPLIFHWPGHVPAGTNDQLVSNVDFLPTMIDYLGLASLSEGQPRPPGQSFAAVLRGGTVADWHDAIYYEFENVRAIRTERWKYIERFKQAPNELYDLRNDPEELNNLIDSSEHAVIRSELSTRMHAWFAEVADPKWDLWHGGRSKTGLIMQQLFKRSSRVGS